MENAIAHFGIGLGLLVIIGVIGLIVFHIVGVQKVSELVWSFKANEKSVKKYSQYDLNVMRITIVLVIVGLCIQFLNLFMGGKLLCPE